MEAKKKNLLLIEDDKIDQMAFVRFVDKENFSFEYEIAGSVKEAKTMLAQKRYEVIVSDYHLGDGTALDILKDLKDTPLVVTTGTGDEETAVEAMKSGAYDYLIKDVEGNYLKMLPLTVANAISHFKSVQELADYNKNLEQQVKERTAALEIEVSVRKKAETELLKHKDHLEQIVKDRTAELEGKNAELERFNKVFVDREFRIKELKERVLELEGNSF